MKIETITYRRVKNLGNFQSETLEATVRIESDSEPDKVMADLKQWVLQKLDILPRSKEPDINIDTIF